MRDYLSEIKARDELVAREKAENDAALIKARQTGRSISFIAADGCEVTVTPSGHILHNAADWW